MKMRRKKGWTEEWEKKQTPLPEERGLGSKAAGLGFAIQTTHTEEGKEAQSKESG